MLLALLLALAPVAAARGPASAPSWMRPQYDLTNYLAIAATYATPNRKAALQEIREWQVGEVQRAVAGLKRRDDRLRAVPSAPGQIAFGVVEAAVLLHAEAGLIALQSLSIAEAEAHLSASVTLLVWSRGAADRLRRRGLSLQERIDPREYHVALASAALAIGFPPTARSFAEAARRAAPTDAEVQLVYGCVAEGLAVEDLLQHRESEAERWRAEAELGLRDALALEGGLQEARLHLGRLLLESGRLVEAEGLLAEVDARAADDRQRYLSRLFLGRLAERRLQPDDAIGHYRRALEVWPDSQAARLALGHALEGSAGPAASRPLVAASLAASQRFLGRAADPWWLYPFGPPGVARAALDRVWEKALDQ